MSYQRVRWLVAGGCASAAGVLAVLVSLGWAPLLRFDTSVEMAAHRLVAPATWLRVTATVVTQFGAPVVVDVITVVAAVMLLARRRRRAALFVVAVRVGALAIETAVKAAVGRPRPPLSLHLVHATGLSFPSGHATGATAVYGALLLLRPTRRRGVAVVVIVAGVAASRVLLGVHYVTDVAAGMLLSTAWLALLARYAQPVPLGQPPGRVAGRRHLRSEALRRRLPGQQGGRVRGSKPLTEFRQGRLSLDPPSK